MVKDEKERWLKMKKKAKRITSLDELKAWNVNPTIEKPVVLEWFMDWFFEELLGKGDTEIALEARNVLIEFVMICEGLTDSEATERVDKNFDYYSKYSVARWEQMWKSLKIREMNRVE